MLKNKLLSAMGGAPANYIEDVFSTYLYTGNGSTQTITNGIDLAGKGGLVWVKCRSLSSNQTWSSTDMGATNYLTSDTTGSLTTNANALTAFNSNGFSVGSLGNFNSNTAQFVSWAFRKQRKFFTCLTYTGNGIAGRQIPHDLGSVPGCIIVKSSSNTGTNWSVYHRTMPNTDYVRLNTTAAQATNSRYWNSTTPTDTVFTVGDSGDVNNTGWTYVAYLFAHNAGGFGLTGTDNVISCGSVTIPASGTIDVNLGYEPQFVMLKATNYVDGWYMFDTMRGWTNGGSDAWLYANSSAAEASAALAMNPTATGFNIGQDFGATVNYIYIAIRRGPMKVPTSGTSVFSPVAYTGNATDTTRSAGFPVDMLAILRRSNPFGDGDGNPRFMDRLRGGNSTSLISSSASAEETSTNNTLYLDNSVGFKTTANNPGAPTGYYFNVSTNPYIAECFRRAPSFFDEVCYSGTGANQLVDHNLGVVPELVIFKARNDPSAQTPPWAVQVPNVLGTGYLRLNTIDANSAGFFAGLPTATQLKTRVNSNSAVNASGYNYVAYLFATCAGVSKVGSYTGTGATQTISCGFSGGARFVLVKRTDSTGDWYVWDTARGMVSGTDPSLLLNSTAAEVNANSIYTTTGGFQIVSTAAGINASGATYIYLAIA